jgi:23S rRNA (uracil1939-C5)-methyltransferase
MEVVVGNLVAGGDAIARLPSGKVVFVDGALPGETVDIDFTTSRKDFSRARVVGVLAPAEERVDPPCKFAGQCGGCRWQHFAASSQFTAKARIAAESLVRIGRLELSDEMIENSMRHGRIPSAGYRTTIRVAFDAGGRVGFRARGSNEVVPIDSCLVAHPLINRVLPNLSAIPGADVEVTIRCSTTTEVVGAMVHGNEGDVSGLDAFDVVGPDARLIETVHGVDLVVSMGAFFQSGPAAAALLVDVVRHHAGPEALSGAYGQVVDAYGGGGLFSATLVPSHVPVTLLEENPWAVNDARVNLSGHSATIHQAQVEEWQARPAGLVIADPARTGLGRAGVDALTATKASLFVLISCDAAAGARDARMLNEAGYELEAYSVLDLFPHTHHLEMVMRFRRLSPVDESRPVTRPVARDVPPAA